MTTTTEAPPGRTVRRLPGLHHHGLTVRDIATSEAWYNQVLGLVRAFVEPLGTGDGYAVVMTRPGTGLFVGLDHHPEADRQTFSALHTGLDHLALDVTSRDALYEWVSHLDALGIEHEAIFESTEPVPHALVAFRDPDGIAIELFCLAARMTDPLQLPPREGSRPHTSNELPHCQLDQQPADSRHVDAILADALTWPSVLGQPSQISVEGGRALTLDDGTPGGPTEAFLIGREFCHVHARGDLSLHAVKPSMFCHEPCRLPQRIRRPTRRMAEAGVASVGSDGSQDAGRQVGTAQADDRAVLLQGRRSGSAVTVCRSGVGRCGHRHDLCR